MDSTEQVFCETEELQTISIKNHSSSMRGKLLGKISYQLSMKFISNFCNNKTFFEGFQKTNNVELGLLKNNLNKNNFSRIP